MSNPNEYSTSNLALAAYVALYGLKYNRADVRDGRNGREQVVFVFDDEGGVGKELEMAFVGSQEKRYQSFLLFFRQSIDKALTEHHDKKVT